MATEIIMAISSAGSPTNFSGFNSDCIACVVSSGGVTSVKTFAISKMTMTLNTTLKPCTMPSFERLMIHQLQMAFSLEKNSAFMMNIKTKNQNIRFTEPIAVESGSFEIMISAAVKASTKA